MLLPHDEGQARSKRDEQGPTYRTTRRDHCRVRELLVVLAMCERGSSPVRPATPKLRSRWLRVSSFRAGTRLELRPRRATWLLASPSHGTFRLFAHRAESVPQQVDSRQGEKDESRPPYSSETPKPLASGFFVSGRYSPQASPSPRSSAPGVAKPRDGPPFRPLCGVRSE